MLRDLLEIKLLCFCSDGTDSEVRGQGCCNIRGVGSLL